MGTVRRSNFIRCVRLAASERGRKAWFNARDARSRRRLRSPAPARATIAARCSGCAAARFVVGIADIAGFEQHGGDFGAAKHVEGGEAVRLRAQLEPAGRLVEPGARQGRPTRSSARASRGPRASPRTDPSGSLDRPSPAAFSLGRKPCGLGVRRDVGQRIDGRAARQRIGRAVHVERNEHARRPAAGRSPRAGRASDSGRRRGSSRRVPGRARRACREAPAPAPASAPFR